MQGVRFLITPVVSLLLPTLLTPAKMAFANHTWTRTGSLNTRRYFNYTATLLPNGRVRVVGGIGDIDSSDFTVRLASAELYDGGAIAL